MGLDVSIIGDVAIEGVILREVGLVDMRVLTKPSQSQIRLLWKRARAIPTPRPTRLLARPVCEPVRQGQVDRTFSLPIRNRHSWIPFRLHQVVPCEAVNPPVLLPGERQPYVDQVGGQVCDLSQSPPQFVKEGGSLCRGHPSVRVEFRAESFAVGRSLNPVAHKELDARVLPAEFLNGHIRPLGRTLEGPRTVRPREVISVRLLAILACRSLSHLLLWHQTGEYVDVGHLAFHLDPVALRNETLLKGEHPDKGFRADASLVTKELFVNDLDAVDHGGDAIAVAVDGNTGMQPTPLQRQQPDVGANCPLSSNLGVDEESASDCSGEKLNTSKG